MRGHHLFWLGLLTGLLAACHGRGGSPAIVRDSAGVRVVENSGPLWRPGQGWTIDERPLLDIGGNSADPHYDLLQVVDAVRLGDGRIAVMNDGVPDLRFYDSTGTYLGTTGRAGDGPGEFRRIASIQLGRGDSIFLYDAQLRRVNRIAPDGTFLSSVPVLASGGKMGLQPLARLPDGSWVAIAQKLPNLGGSGGVQRDTMALLHLPATLEGSGDTIGSFPGTEVFLSTGGEGAQRFARLMLVPLGLSTTFALQDTLVDVGNPERYEIRAYRADGALVRIIRRPVAREPLTRAELGRMEADELASVDARGKERLEAAWRDVPAPSLKPAFATIRTDQNGDLWVEHVKVVRADPGTADVFDAQGRLLGSVALPPGLQITRIGPDYVLGVWRDDMDLEHVRMYRLRKPGAPPI
jgi:hypothetical protein